MLKQIFAWEVHSNTFNDIWNHLKLTRISLDRFLVWFWRQIWRKAAAALPASPAGSYLNNSALSAIATAAINRCKAYSTLLYIVQRYFAVIMHFAVDLGLPSVPLPCICTCTHFGFYWALVSAYFLCRPVCASPQSIHCMRHKGTFGHG